MNTTIRLYAMVVSIYALAVVITQAILGASPLTFLLETLRSIPDGFALFTEIAWKGVLPLIAAAILLRRYFSVERTTFAISVLVVQTVMLVLFLSFKPSMTDLLPFWADPLMANIDHSLHGVDPYRITFAILGNFPASAAYFIYADMWFLPAIYLPIWIALIDPDDLRVRRFILLHSFVWVILGSVLALAVLSAGPVFYDRLLDSDRFDGLTQALVASGIDRSSVGIMHADLWTKYSTGRNAAGSGISAFPSVHVGMATVIALYLYERAPRFVFVSIAIVAVYQILSVHLGWHYAVDGYASIILVTVVWLALRARNRSSGVRQTAPNQSDAQS